MRVIDRINLELAKKGLNGADLSRAIGVSSGVYSQWCNGTTNPSKKNLAKIADFLKVTVNYLLSGEEKTATPKGSGMSEKDVKLLEWFRSLPPETQKAILYDADAPEGLV